MMRPHFPRLSADCLVSLADAQQGRVRFDLSTQDPGRANLLLPALQSFTLPLAKSSHVPDGAGDKPARQALADFLTDFGQPTRAQDLILTSSSSASYQLLFKLFCAPGDCVLLPAPGYPLVAHLAAHEGLTGLYYPWHWDGDAWHLGLAELARLLQQPRLRLLVLVSPASPIGHSLSFFELSRLAALCNEANVVLVIDEVFSSARVHDAAPTLAPPVPYQALGPVCILNGLSKTMGLAGAKLGWISVEGPATWKRDVLLALAYLEDCVLGVAHGIQAVLPRLLDYAPAMMCAINSRLLRNHGALQSLVGRHPSVSLLPVHSGWYQMVRYPRVGLEDEAFCRTLIAAKQIQLQPGALFDLPLRGVVLGSLLTAPEVFDAGWKEALPHLAVGEVR